MPVDFLPSRPSSKHVSVHTAIQYRLHRIDEERDSSGPGLILVPNVGLVLAVPEIRTSYGASGFTITRALLQRSCSCCCTTVAWWRSGSTETFTYLSAFVGANCRRHCLLNKYCERPMSRLILHPDPLSYMQLRRQGGDLPVGVFKPLTAGRSLQVALLPPRKR